MRIIYSVIIFFFLATPAWTDGLIIGSGSGGGGINYDLRESFGGSTACGDGVHTNCENTWTVVGTGTVDFNVADLDGTGYAVSTDSTTTAVNIYKSFPTSSDEWVFVEFKTTASALGNTIIALQDSGGATQAYIEYSNNSALKISSGTNTATTVSTMTVGNAYCIWTRYTAGTGSNAFAEVGFDDASTCIKPTSGNNYASVSNGVSTANAARIRLNSTTTHTGVFTFDKVRVDNENIGSNPQ